MKIDNTFSGKNKLFFPSDQPPVYLKKRDASLELFDVQKAHATLERVFNGFDHIEKESFFKHLLMGVYDGMSSQELETTLILNATSFIETDPAYSTVAARLLLTKLYKEIFGVSLGDINLKHLYRQFFVEQMLVNIETGFFDSRMRDYDLEVLAQNLVPERDDLFEYMGISTLYERYLLKKNGKRAELPQAFFMRIAMGLAIAEENKMDRAIDFYHVISNLQYVPSTPTLFHAGFPVAQLSSCYINTVKDDLSHIFKVVGDNAQLSKWAGGIGSDWTDVRGTGSYIKSIKATTQGVVPFLKVANDVVAAITRTGIRRGGTCVYLETWHLDIEEFLDLRRNTGDERRRTHDINTANWIPDLFMKRVAQDAQWTLFSSNETPDLHTLYGKAFEDRYAYYEAQAQAGKISNYRELSAKQLWRKMLSRLFETGHPWLTWKDPINIRSPQDHVGVVRSSNLCTEITLNTSETETAVCNLGSLNLTRHIKHGVVDWDSIKTTINLAVRMLDNVIDINFYPTKEARTANTRHRPIGFGMMGFQDALFALRIPFESQKALEFADEVGEFIAYHSIMASSLIAQERGSYETYQGSKWSRGIMPHDTVALVEQERGVKSEISTTVRLDWTPVREHVARYGMRNSNVLSIAPTATISTIAGCYPSIEPVYKNMYVKSNTSGEFTIINKYLVADLKQRGLWQQELIDEIKFYDGDLANIPSIPDDLKSLYKTAFELDPIWLLKITATRGRWICQSTSHNVFVRNVTGSRLHEIYMKAWELGMKTTYYLRTLGATQIEKSTLDAQRFGYTQKREYLPVTKACSIENQDCESCQ